MSSMKIDSSSVQNFFDILNASKPIERSRTARSQNPFISLFERYADIDSSEIPQHVGAKMEFLDYTSLSIGVKYVIAVHLNVEQISSICSFLIRFPDNDAIKFVAGFLTANAKLSLHGCSAQLPPSIKIPVEFVPKDEGILSWKETPMFEGPMPEVMNSHLLIDKFNKDAVVETINRMELVAATKSKNVTDLVPSDMRFDDFPRNFLNDHIPPAATFDSGKCIKEDTTRHLKTNHRRRLLVLWGDGGKLANVVYDSGPWEEVVWVFSKDYTNVCLSPRLAYLRFKVEVIEYPGTMADFIMIHRVKFKDFQVLGNYVPEVSLFTSDQALYAILVVFNEKMKRFKKLILPDERRLAILCVESNYAAEIQSGREVCFLDPTSTHVYTYDHHSVWKDRLSTRTSSMLSLKSIAKEVHHVAYKGNICVLSRSVPDSISVEGLSQESVDFVPSLSFPFADAEVFSFSSDRVFKVYYDGVFCYKGFISTFSLIGYVYFSVMGDEVLILDAEIQGTYLQRRDFLKKRFVPMVDCNSGDKKIFVNGPPGLIYEIDDQITISLDVLLDDGFDYVRNESIVSTQFFGLAVFEGSLVSSFSTEFFHYPDGISQAKLSASEIGKGYRLRMGRKNYVRWDKFYFEELLDHAVTRVVSADLIRSKLFNLPPEVKDDLLSLLDDIP